MDKKEKAEIKQLFKEIEEKTASTCDHWEKGALSNWIKALVNAVDDPFSIRIFKEVKQHNYLEGAVTEVNTTTRYWAQREEE
ncbi:MAG: hypothetical protein ACW98W_14130 [Candidatus Hodarchaeales archaeon]|jgi:hypothetical protein